MPLCHEVKVHRPAGVQRSGPWCDGGQEGASVRREPTFRGGVAHGHGETVRRDPLFWNTYKHKQSVLSLFLPLQRSDLRAFRTRVEVQQLCFFKIQSLCVCSIPLYSILSFNTHYCSLPSSPSSILPSSLSPSPSLPLLAGIPRQMV